MAIELKETEFRAIINEVNQITVPKIIRDKLNVSSGTELIFEVTGLVSKAERRIVPKIDISKNREDKK